MPKPVEIRLKSHDHVEFCERCMQCDDNGYWSCGAVMGRFANRLCAFMRECPLGKWRRV